MATGTKSLKTIVFLGSVREGRMGLRVAKFIVKQLEAADHVVELFGKRTRLPGFTVTAKRTETQAQQGYTK